MTSSQSVPGGPADSTQIGSLLGPHGVQGGIKLFVLGDASQIRALKRVYVQGKGWLPLRRTEPLAPGLVVHLAGVNTREGAEELRGLLVYAADAELPPLEEGEYYYHDLRGLKVQDESGAELGRVTDVQDMGHQDILVVSDGEYESFVPLQAPYVVIKIAAGRPQAVLITSDAPAGLIGEEPDEPTED